MLGVENNIKYLWSIKIEAHLNLPILRTGLQTLVFEVSCLSEQLDKKKTLPVLWYQINYVTTNTYVAGR